MLLLVFCLCFALSEDIIWVSKTDDVNDMKDYSTFSELEFRKIIGTSMISRSGT